MGSKYELTCDNAEALDSLVRQGKALYVGVSNDTAEQTRAIRRNFRRIAYAIHWQPNVIQDMFNREAEQDNMLDILAAHHAGLIAYGPLAEAIVVTDTLPRCVSRPTCHCICSKLIYC